MVEARSGVTLRLLHSPEEARQVEAVQRRVWGEDGIVSFTMLLAAIHNGGILIGAFLEEELAGFVFGFPGAIETPQGLRLKHCSHMLAVLPEHRNLGLGFQMKRAQWQMIRKSGVELITWTFDPLLSTNAHLNIARLGAVTSTYLRDFYGEMNDNLNAGLPTDRFQVDLWVNSTRVESHMSGQPRRQLELGDYFSAGAQIVNPTRLDGDGWPRPPESAWIPATLPGADRPAQKNPTFYLVEIPPDFMQIKSSRPELAVLWRQHSRSLFETLFQAGYLVTDFVFLRGDHPRSFYVLSDGERQMEGIITR